MTLAPGASVLEGKNMKTKTRLLFVLSAWMIALVTVLAGLKDLDLGRTLVTHASYYLIFIMTGFWAFLVFPFIQSALKGKLIPVLISFSMTLAVFISIPPHYRVLSDETNLLSVSQSMTYRRDISNVTQSKFYYGNFNVIQGDLPTRPLLFPFLTSLVHTATGYRYQNVFILNFIVLFSLLLMTFLCIEPRLGRLSAVAACLLLLSIPTLTLSATSGGFDVCSLLFFMLSLVFLQRFMTKPDPERFAMLAINLILLSQIRYESIAYVVVIFAGLLIFKKFNRQMLLQNAVLLSALPFFVLPMLLQRKLTPNTYENPPGVPPFSVDHFLKHAGILIDSMIHLKPEYPYPGYLNWLAVLMLGILAAIAGPRLKKTLGIDGFRFTLLLLICVALSLLIVLSHHFGIFPHPTQARLFLIFLSFLALMPLTLRYFYPNLLTEKRLFAIAAVSFALYHPVATQARFTHSLTIIRETDEIYRFIEAQNDPRLMIIAERPGQFTVMDHGAIGFGFANANRDSLIGDLNRGLVSNIWVFQKHLYETGRPISDQNLDAAYTLEPVRDFMVTATEFIRISRVKGQLNPIREAKSDTSRPELKKLDPGMKDLIRGLKL
jgi:hypothetical protein